MEDKENFVEICRNASILDVTAVMEALENGADVNEKELDTESTGLMMAVQKNNEPLVSLLLQQPEIDVNAKDKDGYTALHFAVKENSKPFPQPFWLQISI